MYQQFCGIYIFFTKCPIVPGSKSTPENKFRIMQANRPSVHCVAAAGKGKIFGNVTYKNGGVKREPRLFLVFRATPSLPLCLEFLLNHPSPPQLFCCEQKSLGICCAQHSSSTGSCELRAKKRPHMGADDRYFPCQYFSAEHAASCTIFSASHLVSGAASFSRGRHQRAQSSQHLRLSPCLPC